MKLLTQNLLTAYAKYGIRINAACPGYIAPTLLRNINHQQKEYLTFLHPQGRFGKPEEVATAVLFSQVMMLVLLTVQHSLLMEAILRVNLKILKHTSKKYIVFNKKKAPSRMTALFLCKSY